MNDFYQDFQKEEAPAPAPVPAAKPAAKKNDWWMNLLLCFFVAMFVVCVVVIATKLVGAKQEKDNYDKLAEIAGMEDNTPAGPTQAELDEAAAAAAEQERLDRLIELHEMNEDFSGWLSIPDTNINYPVMCTPDDVEYYLHRDFYKEKAVGGVPFLGGGCTPFSSSIIMHGHHMKNGTMFADLMKYMKKDFWQQHPVVYYSTLEKDGAYEVMAAFNYDASVSTAPDAFNLYRYGGDLDQEAFNTLMGYVGSHKIYDTGITAEYGDRLLILSTCAYHTENGRFIVVARQKAA